MHDPNYPTQHLRSLSIYNLTDMGDSKLTASPHFKSCLSRISELRLKLWTTVGSYAAPLPQLFTPLHRDWLGPTAKNLTSLTFYGNILW
jgi:hypothetical protein